jgi:hypothetical protein
MDNQDNLFNKIKSAAENAETKEFPGMEKVWSRIDAKLDTKVEKKNNTNWKVLLVAASVLLLVSIGYQFFKSDERIEIPQNEVVKSDAKENSESELKLDTNSITNPNIKANASGILEKQIASQNQVALNFSSSSNDDSREIATDSLIENSNGSGAYNLNSKKSTSKWYVNKNFESRGVVQEEADKIPYSITVKDAKEEVKKLEPLVIVNGEVSKKQLSNLDEEEIDSVLELPEPLYIINSVYYTEKELFGPNPTSPYAPLNKQNIETISVLQPEKAVTIYGEKGKKGVVIVTTKDGKPLPKKKE